MISGTEEIRPFRRRCELQVNGKAEQVTGKLQNAAGRVKDLIR